MQRFYFANLMLQLETDANSWTKCPGCRCFSPSWNERCGCCQSRGAASHCLACGIAGDLDADLLLTSAGPIHDDCR